MQDPRPKSRGPRCKSHTEPPPAPQTSSPGSCRSSLPGSGLRLVLEQGDHLVSFSRWGAALTKAKARGTDLEQQTPAGSALRARPPAPALPPAPHAHSPPPSAQQPRAPHPPQSPRGRPPPRTARRHHEMRLLSPSAPNLRVGLGLRGPRSATALPGVEPRAPRSGRRLGAPLRARVPPALASRSLPGLSLPACHLDLLLLPWCLSDLGVSARPLLGAAFLLTPPSAGYCAGVCSWSPLPT